MPNIDLSILNQRQTPAFYADVFANRPAAGFVGRIFVSTDTYAFYRDNGTGWDLIGGPGTGTVTGSGAAGQVAFWSGSSLISGENNLWWDSTNNHFGINTNTPGTAADIHHNQSTILQLNQTTATNDTRIAFQNSGTSLWRIGNFYNGGANDLGIFDVVGNIQPLTVKKNTGQVLIGTSTVGAGKLVVASASGDNGIQIVGATAPSLRIDSAESGPTKRAGLGISTATNNFIQGSADRDFCIFNGSTAAASPILFGIYDAGAVNVQEAARISAARNFLIGTTTDTGQKLQVSGQFYLSSAATVVSYINTTNASGASNVYQQSNVNVGWIGNGSSSLIGGSTTDFTINGVNNLNLAVGGFGRAIINSSGNFGIGVNPSAWNSALKTIQALNASISNNGGTSVFGSNVYYDSAYTPRYISNGLAGAILYNSSGAEWSFNQAISGTAGNAISFTQAMTLSSANNLLIGTTTDNGQKLQVNGDVNATTFNSIRGLVSVAPSSATTFFTPTTVGLYIAHVFLSGNATQTWDAAIIFLYNAVNVITFTQVNGTNVLLSVSGTNIQVTQLGGATYSFNYDIMKIR